MKLLNSMGPRMDPCGNQKTGSEKRFLSNLFCYIAFFVLSKSTRIFKCIFGKSIGM